MQKNTILIVVMALALGGAGYLVFRFARSGGADSIPEGPSTITHWMCYKCRKPFDQTSRQVQARLDAKQFKFLESNNPVFMCDTCKDFTVCRAEKCPHDVWYCIGRKNDFTCKTCLSGK